MKNNSDYALITASTGGVGGGFIRPLANKRGYHTYLQYRPESESKRKESEERYPSDNVTYFPSSLTDEEQLVGFFQKIASEQIIFTIMVLAAGAPGIDPENKSQEESIADFKAANFLTKKVPITAFLLANPLPPKKRIHLFLICSHVALYTDEFLADHKQDFGNQIGYIYSMRDVYEYGKWLIEHCSEYFIVHIEFTEQVETKGYDRLRSQLKEANKIDIGIGIDPEVYAEKVLTNAGL